MNAELGARNAETVLLGIVRDERVEVESVDAATSHAAIWPGVHHARWRHYPPVDPVNPVQNLHWTDEPSEFELALVDQWFERRNVIIKRHLMLHGMPVQADCRRGISVTEMLAIYHRAWPRRAPRISGCCDPAE